jgi:hypothetical protein
MLASGAPPQEPAKDPFAGESVPIIPGLEEKLRKPYADILTPYDGFREQHPCAKGKSVEELQEQWDRGANKVKKLLSKAKPGPNPPKYLSVAEAARYLNKQFTQQDLPFRVWLMALPWPGEDREKYYHQFLGQGVGLTSNFYIDYPTVSLYTMLLTIHDARSWSYWVFDNGDIVFAQMSGD